MRVVCAIVVIIAPFIFSWGEIILINLIKTIKMCNLIIINGWQKCAINRKRECGNKSYKNIWVKLTINR